MLRRIFKRISKAAVTIICEEYARFRLRWIKCKAEGAR
jgi:hypothetical protein